MKAYRLPVLSLALAWTLFAGVAVFSIGKPLTLDQAWPVAFQAGSIADRGFAELGRGPYEIAHPPLYMHLLALVFLVFGESDFSARALGLALFAVTSILVVRLADLAFPADRGARIGGIAAILYAASPMVVQHSLLVDGTTTLLPAFTCALLVALYRADFRVTGRNAWSIGGWFALCVWVHESLALLPLAALALYLWSAMGLRVAARESFAILTCGLGLFAASWLVYVSTTGVDSLSFVQFSVVEKLLAPGQESAAVLLTRVWTNARWLSLALLALLGTFALRRIRAFSGARTVEPSDLLWIYVGLVLLVTNTLWTQLPRYMFAAYAPICVLLAAGIVHSGVRIAAWALVAGVAAGVALAMLLGDPLLLSMRAYVAWAVVLPVIGAWLALRLTRSIPTAGPQASSTFLLAALSVAVWTHVEQTAPYTTSVSWTEYGESGFSATQRFLEGDARGTVPVIRKDHAYALLRDSPNRSLEWIYTRMFRQQLGDPTVRESVAEKLSREGVEIVVLDRYSDSRAARDLVSEDFREVARHGDFSVFRRREKEPPALSDLAPHTGCRDTRSAPSESPTAPIASPPDTR